MGGSRSRLGAALALLALSVVGLGWSEADGQRGASAAPRQGRVHVEPQVTFAVPPKSAGCGGASPWPGGGQRVPLAVSVVAGQVAESVNVCVGGRGPFPFVLDTGAGQSTIDAGLARRLHLRAAGPAVTYDGVGCSGVARPVSVGSWSLEGVGLAPQQLNAATLPQMGGRGEPVGLLGSDVLSRFGTVRVDFTAGALVVAGSEGSPLDRPASTSAAGSAPLPSLTGGGGVAVPVAVSRAPGDVSLAVAVRFAGAAPRSFIVDTGTSQSVVSTALARAQALGTTDLAQRQSTVCSVVTVPLVHSGPWSVPGAALVPQLLGATPFGTIGLAGTQGLLGSDQLRRFGWVVLDYQGARLVLG